jgi:hypothetical protein
MKIDLDELPSYRDCKENRIEIQKCFEFYHQVDYDGKDSIFDIPEEHITWMILKGII